MITIREAQQLIGEWGKRKGWEFTEKDIPEKLMLICTEASEAMEDYRKDDMITYSVLDIQGNNKPCGFPSELADIIIRVLHLADHLGIDMQNEIQTKMNYNELRDHRHGGLKA